MELEYIDISQDERDGRAPARGTRRKQAGNESRISGSASQKVIRQENQRGPQTDEQEKVSDRRGSLSKEEGPQIIGAVRKKKARPEADRVARIQKKSVKQEEAKPAKASGQNESGIEVLSVARPQRTRVSNYEGGQSVRPKSERQRQTRVQGQRPSRLYSEEQRVIRSEAQRSARPRPQGQRQVRVEGQRYARPNPEIQRAAKSVSPEMQRARIQRRKRKKQKVMAARMTVMFFCILVMGLSGFWIFKLFPKPQKKERIHKVEDTFNPNVEEKEVVKSNEIAKPVIKENFITVNEYSRPGEPLEKVNNIFVHYTANPKTTAAQNRSYFQNLGTTGETSASAHFVIGYEGEIVQCIPLDEIAYAVMGRNYDSISIECCYLSSDGKFEDATYQSLIQLSAWLLKEYNLAPKDMRRHYDEGGKKCPLYYVEHDDAWWQFLSDLEDYITKTQL